MLSFGFLLAFSFDQEVLWHSLAAIFSRYAGRSGHFCQDEIKVGYKIIIDPVIPELKTEMTGCQKLAASRC